MKVKEELKSDIADALLECVGYEGLVETLLLLSHTSTSDEERAMWEEGFSILTGCEVVPLAPMPVEPPPKLS